MQTMSRQSRYQVSYINEPTSLQKNVDNDDEQMINDFIM